MSIFWDVFSSDVLTAIVNIAVIVGIMILVFSFVTTKAEEEEDDK